ncbi:MAG: chloride channel protein [Lautropia sp.]
MSAFPPEPAPPSGAETPAPLLPTARERRRRRLKAWRETFRSRLAHADAIVGLSILAVIAGLVTGALIIVFRLVTERGLVWIGVLDRVEGFEALAWPWRLCLPIAGGLAIGLLVQALPLSARQVGPVHVMARLAKQGGRLPWINAVVQFVGGALSILSGHSVGREGPVIHLGAASASLLGQALRLPNNSIRTLVACGVAASIAASFNTPIAGVVFAMEVVMFEYTLVGFAPVILAAVSATSISRIVFGSAPAFSVPTFQLSSLLELPWVLMLGFAVSLLAAAYVHGIAFVDRLSQPMPPWIRTTLAGAVVGCCALIAPEVMGLGYDTVQAAMLGGLGLAALGLIVAAKLVATVACGGLGLPGGLIGPMVVIGAAAGGALGIVGQALVPDASAPPAFYATLGVVAMMGACLQAPLAALMAILELTGNPNTILPGMAAVMTAFLVSRVALRQKPIFITMLAARGIEYRVDPVALALDRTGVRAVMSQRYAVVDAGTAPEALATVLRASPEWIVVVENRIVRGVLPRQMLGGEDALAPRTRILPDPAAAGGTPAGGDPPAVALPATLPPFATVYLHSTLGEALAALDERGIDIVVVADAPAPQVHQLHGVLSRRQIEGSVRYRR